MSNIAQVSTELRNTKVENRQTKKKKTDMLTSRPVGKQTGESAESVIKKKTKATVGRICRKGRFRA